MITDNLFKTIFIHPMLHGGSELFVVSGYASPSLVNYHLNKCRDRINVNLIVGMTGKEGIGRRSHEAFQQLSAVKFKDEFECRYVCPPHSVHTKSYAWFGQNGAPIVGFTGSPNYTMRAFSGYQEEAVVEDNAGQILDYYRKLYLSSIDCLDPKVENYIYLYDEIKLKHQSIGRPNIDSLDIEAVVKHPKTDIRNITISLLDSSGSLPERSGLNWGQRLDRDPNQAYIRIPAEVYRTDFFPDRGKRFVIYTDDGTQLNCTTAQETKYGQRGKAVHSYEDNSILGLYFRNRLELNSKALVTLADLQSYGRTDITFYKIDNETYYMDFSSTPNSSQLY